MNTETNTSPCVYYRRSIDALAQEATRCGVPTVADEVALVKSAKRGDKRAIHRLVLGHLRLVLKMAHGLSRGNRDLFEELSAAGIAGMIQAIDVYDSKAGGRFIHYASFHIRRAMRRGLNDFRTPVSANPNNYDLARKIFEFEEKTLREEGRRATHAETGKKFGLTPNRVERMKKLLESPMYLDHAIGGEDERYGHDVCADKAAASPALATEMNMEADMLQEVMKAHLNEREIAILQRRFGFEGGNTEDLHAIGSTYRLSRERIRQIEAAALKKLRFHLSQACPTYRQRANTVGGVHPAMVPSRLNPVAIGAAPVATKAIKKPSAAAKVKMEEAVLVA